MKNITLIGAYGTNLGDNLILLSIMKKMQDNGMNIELNILTNYPNELKNFVNKLYKNKKIKINYIKITQMSKLIITIIKSDLVLYGGGGLISDDWSFKSYAYLLPILIAKILNKKIAMFSIGVSKPTSTIPLFITKIMFSNVDFISVRDKNSYMLIKKFLKSKKPIVNICCDPVFSLKFEKHNINKIDYNDNELYILLALRYIYKHNVSYEKLKLANKKILLKILECFINIDKKIKIVLIPFNKHPKIWYENDTMYISFIEKIFKKRNISVYILDNYDKMLEVINRKKTIIISNRLHPLILSITLNKPFIPIAIYSQKISNVLKTCEINSFISNKPDEICLNIKKLINLSHKNRNELLDKIYKCNIICRKLNQKCFNELFRLIKS